MDRPAGGLTGRAVHFNCLIPAGLDSGFFRLSFTNILYIYVVSFIFLC